MSKISGGFVFQRPLGRGGFPAGGPTRPGALCGRQSSQPGFVFRLWRNGIFGKLVVGNVLRGRRPYAGGGPARAGVRNPGGAADNTKPFPP